NVFDHSFPQVVPLVLGPLSEIYGRSIIYLISATLHTLCYLPEALIVNLPSLLVFRFSSGATGSAALCVVAGTIVDLFPETERGPPMAAFSIVAFGSPSAGSVVFSYVVEHLGYRYVNWVLFALSSIITLVLFGILKESRTSVLLQRKAARLQKGDSTVYYVSTLDKPVNLTRMLSTAFSLPLRMLFTEPVLAGFTLWISFTWSVLYLTLVSVPIVYKTMYHFGTGATGLVYISQIVGVCLGFLFDCACTPPYKRNLPEKGPEARLYTGLGAAVFIPIGSFLWAFTTYPQVHFVVPCFGMAVLYVGMYCCFLSTHAYLADAYTSCRSFLHSVLFHV
ncbi:hypothetical protein JCM8547_008256, partial [Rhodosporidiobolus lusitaniae]